MPVLPQFMRMLAPVSRLCASACECLRLASVCVSRLCASACECSRLCAPVSRLCASACECLRLTPVSRLCASACECLRLASVCVCLRMLASRVCLRMLASVCVSRLCASVCVCVRQRFRMLASVRVFASVRVIQVIRVIQVRGTGSFHSSHSSAGNWLISFKSFKRSGFADFTRLVFKCLTCLGRLKGPCCTYRLCRLYEQTFNILI